MSETTDIETDGEKTPLDIADDHTGLDLNWSNGADWPHGDYARTPMPDESERPKKEWSVDERRAYLLTLVREHGHPDNIPMRQKDIGEAFGKTQQQISHDMDMIRKYLRFYAGDKAISTTELVAQKAVTEGLEEANSAKDYYDIMRTQLEYNEWLFELGRLERQPRKQKVESVSISADASDLTEEEEAHLEVLDEQLRGKSRDDAIDVEAHPVEDEDDE